MTQEPTSTTPSPKNEKKDYLEFNFEIKGRSQVNMASLMFVAGAILGNTPRVEGIGSSRMNSAKKIAQSDHFMFNDVSLSSLTKLSYRSHSNLAEEQNYQAATEGIARCRQPQHIVSNVFHTWWTSAKSRRAILQAAADKKDVEDEQMLLDQYLESLDRRYKRVHQHELKTTERSGVISIVDWLTLSEPSSKIDEQRKREDAIYVFGLAEVASKNLLRRHHLPIPDAISNDTNFSFVDAAGAASFVHRFQNIMKTLKRKTHSMLQALILCKQSVTSMFQIGISIAIFFRRHLIMTTYPTYALRLSSTLTQRLTKFTALSSSKSSNVSLPDLISIVTPNGPGKHAIYFASTLFASVVTYCVTFLHPSSSKS